jgi:hypothetical protein
MKSRVAFLAVMILVVFSTLVYAADVTGKWTAQVPGRGGQTRETIFTFKVAGTALTGTVSGRQADTAISDGKVAGDDISFVVKMSMGGNDVVVNYKGKIAGDEIKFTSTRQGADQAQEFTAKRAK